MTNLQPDAVTGINPQAADVLVFWFGTGDERGRMHKKWFEKNPEFDAQIQARFLPLYEEAAAGRLEGWRTSALECLALIVVLDQFPRNMFRGSARAFAADPLAREAAHHMLAQGWDKRLLPVERIFAYLPLEHCETLANQELCLKMMHELAVFPETQDMHVWAEKHRVIIERFGRFPHRNAALGRASTPEEIAFLQQPGSGF